MLPSSDSVVPTLLPSAPTPNHPTRLPLIGTGGFHEQSTQHEPPPDCRHDKAALAKLRLCFSVSPPPPRSVHASSTNDIHARINQPDSLSSYKPSASRFHQSIDNPIKTALRPRPATRQPGCDRSTGPSRPSCGTVNQIQTNVNEVRMALQAMSFLFIGPALIRRRERRILSGPEGLASSPRPQRGPCQEGPRLDDERWKDRHMHCPTHSLWHHRRCLVIIRMSWGPTSAC